VPLRSAGGVAARSHPEYGTEVAIVHRPRFDDWSLPKGKLKRHEHPLAAAVREVHEETGVTAVVGARLPTVGYDVWANDELREKVVDYWVMTATGTSAWQAGREVDEVTWLPVDQAMKQLSYPHDRRVLRAFAELPVLGRPILVLRHASAGERASWTGDDQMRPLDELGHQQAAALAGILPLFGPTTLISAEPMRCQQTLNPLAQALNLVVQLDSRFNEGGSPEEAADLLRALSDPDGAVVVCSQGGLIPDVVRQLNGQAAGRYRTAKGEGWALSFAEGRLAAIDAVSTET
jgi:8-oxo-dGTP pyrophosphatase MutT (NUDIX family)/phosphohistidine phosphatase SixA